MRTLTLVLGLGCAVLTLRADDLGSGAAIEAGDAWKNVPLGPADPPAVAPTLKYVPKDGRNAAVFVTLFPASVSQVTDLPSLRDFLLKASSPMFPSPDFVPQVTTVQTKDGTAVYAVFVDPSLVGKPVDPDNYKVATPTEVLLKNGWTVQGTVFTDDQGSAAWKEGLAIVLSARGRGVTTASAADSFSVPQADATLRFPPGRFRIQDPGPVRAANYFSRVDGVGVVLTGWLSPVSQFAGMPAFWAKERTALVAHGFEPTEETAEEVGGWSAVRYAVVLPGGTVQRNIRACRVVGATWADLHTSVTSTDSSWEELEDLLKQVGLVAKAP